MQNEANSFDDKIRESVSNYSFPFDDAHWQAMQGRLPLVVPTPWWKTWQTMAAVIAILLTSNVISLYFLSLKSTQTSEIVNYIPVYHDTLNVFEPTQISTSSVAFAQKVEVQNSLEANQNSGLNNTNTWQKSLRKHNPIVGNKEVWGGYGQVSNLRKWKSLVASHSSQETKQNIAISALVTPAEKKTIVAENTPAETVSSIAELQASAPQKSKMAIIADSVKKPIVLKDTIKSSPKKSESRLLLSIYLANETVNWSKIHSRYEQGSVIGGRLSYQLNKNIGIETGLLLARSKYTNVHNGAMTSAGTTIPTFPEPLELKTSTVNQRHWQIPVQVQCQIFRYKKVGLVAAAGVWVRHSVAKIEENSTIVQQGYVGSIDTASSQVQAVVLRYDSGVQKALNGGTNISIGIAWQLNPNVSLQIAPYWQKNLSQKPQTNGQSFGVGASLGCKL